MNEMATMEERMATVEATLPHLATKADVYKIALMLTGVVIATGGAVVTILLRFG